MESDLSMCSSTGCAPLHLSESGDEIPHVVVDDSDDDKSLSIVSGESKVSYGFEL